MSGGLMCGLDDAKALTEAGLTEGALAERQGTFGKREGAFGQREPAFGQWEGAFGQWKRAKALAEAFAITPVHVKAHPHVIL